MESRDGANHIQGNLSAEGRSFGVVASRFNDFIVRPLLDGALDAIRRHGGDPGSVDVVWVPGSYEIPVAAKQLALSGRYDAIICLGPSSAGRRPTSTTSRAGRRAASPRSRWRRTFR